MQCMCEPDGGTHATHKSLMTVWSEADEKRLAGGVKRLRVSTRLTQALCTLDDVMCSSKAQLTNYDRSNFALIWQFVEKSKKNDAIFHL